MATQVQLRRGTTAEHAAFTGAEGECTVDTTLGELRVHDGTTSGGHSVAKKSYVDSLVAGLKWKASVRAATTAAGTLASSFENGDTIDGITLATGDRILIKTQAAGSENGIYTVNVSGVPTRTTDADAGTELVSAAVFVQEGTVNADRAFVCTNNSITLGSTSITFVGFASVVGALVAANNLSDLASVGTARTNLGLGNMAVVDNPVQTGRVVQLIKEQGTTNLISVGIQAATETNPGSSVDGNNFGVKRYLTGSVANDTSGLITPALMRVAYNGDALMVVSVGNTITDYRLWCGFTNVDLNAVATPTTEHVAAFSYDTVRDGTVFWRTVTSNGSSATVTASSIAIVAATFYILRIVTTASSVLFYINGVLANTHTTTLPNTGINLTLQACVTTLTTATRRFEFARFGLLIP